MTRFLICHVTTQGVFNSVEDYASNHVHAREKADGYANKSPNKCYAIFEIRSTVRTGLERAFFESEI